MSGGASPRDIRIVRLLALPGAIVVALGVVDFLAVGSLPACGRMPIWVKAVGVCTAVTALASLVLTPLALVKAARVRERFDGNTVGLVVLSLCSLLPVLMYLLIASADGLRRVAALVL